MDQHHDVMTERLFVREPFATYLRLEQTRRLDLYNRIANKLSVPKGELDDGVIFLIHHLYEIVCEHHELGISDNRPEDLRSLVMNVVLEFEPEEIPELARALQLRRVSFSANLIDYQQRAREQLVEQLVPRVGHLLRSIRQALRPSYPDSDRPAATDEGTHRARAT